MKKGKAAKVEKVEEPVVVVEPVEEIIPVEPEIKYNSNQQRVIFPKLPVKKIVSYHSGTILADKEPSIELSEEKYQQIYKLFHDHAIDGVVPSSSLLNLVILSGSIDKDRDYLQSIIHQKLQQIFAPQSSISPPLPPPPTTTTLSLPGSKLNSPTNNTTNNNNPTRASQTLTTPPIIDEPLNEQKFLQFFLYFYAPSYYYGQRLRLYVGRGEKEYVKELLYRQCSVNSANGEGLTPLHIAAENNRVDIIDLMVDVMGIAQPVADGEGGSNNGNGVIINAQDKYGWTPLHSAVHNGHLATVVKLLSLPGINVDLMNNMGKTPLHLASAQNRGFIVSRLLAAGASLKVVDKRGMTPLHEAAYRGRVNIYQELSRDERADPNLKDDMGRIAIEYLSAEELNS